MLAVAADVPGAFDRLVEVYEPRVKAAVRRSIRDKASVDDLAQEVFLRLFRARARYRPTARFETFLYRVIFNLCVNHTQSRNRKRALSLDTVEEEAGVPTPADRAGETPLERLEARERAGLVRSALETLPEKQRWALWLSRFEGLGYEEIGRVMELTLPAVKSLLWRARDNLRQRLSPILAQDHDASGELAPGGGQVHG